MRQLLVGPACLLLMAGCQSIRDDYPLKQGLERRLTKLRHRIFNPTYPSSAAHRLRHLFATGGSLTARETRGPRLVARSMSRSVGEELGHVTSIGRDLGALVRNSFADTGRRLNRLAKMPAWARSHLEKHLHNLRSFGDRLRLNRQILPMPGDEARSAEVLPRGRRAGFLERIFARIRP